MNDSNTDRQSPSKWRFLVPMGKLALCPIVLCCAVWGTLALLIDVPIRWLAISLAAAYAVANLGCLFFVLPLRRTSSRALGRAAAVFLGLFAMVLVFWNTLSPSQERDWQADVARTPLGVIEGDEITLRNIRDFHYRSVSDYDSHYSTRTVNLSDMEGVDLFLFYWGSPWIAHPIASFRFKDADPIAISIETRKEVGESYSTIRGFFRQYELIYIVAEERDVVRLRTNFREGEDAYLYRSTSSPERARAIFLDYVRSINELHARPEFYNAVTSNCTTNIRIHLAAADGEKSMPWDIRILLNGKMDELAYERGGIDPSMPFEELKARSHINEAAKRIEDPSAFSSEIRKGLPGF
jgi:hypothetical protein